MKQLALVASLWLSVGLARAEADPALAGSAAHMGGGTATQLAAVVESAARPTSAADASDGGGDAGEARAAPQTTTPAPPASAPGAAASNEVAAGGAPPGDEKSAGPHDGHGGEPRSPGAEVRLGGTEVFTLNVGTAGKTAQQRARQASRALQAILDGKDEPNLRTVPQGDVIAVVAGEDPIIALTQADAEAAGAASLELYAAEITAAVRRAVQAERARSRVAHTVFSISLVVFLGLLSLFAMRKLGELSDRARLWVSDHAATFSLRFRRIELVPPAMVQSAAYVALSIGKRVAQLGLLYIWLVATLSLFEATRGATQRLTGWVITPASHLVARLVTALPLLVVFVIAAAAVWVLLQFVTLYFSSIARGETKVAAIPPSLAPTVSILLRVGIVLTALLLGAPLATGDPDGALPRIGSLILLTLGLSSTPLVACFVVGVWTVFARRMAVGDEVRIGDFEGRIDNVGLMETRLLGEDGESVAIPHLMLLRLAVARREGAPWVNVSLSLTPQVNPGKTKELLRQAALDVAPEARVTLTAADGQGLDFEIAIRHRDVDARSRLLERLLETLSEAGLELSKRPPFGSPLTSSSERAP